MSETGEGNERGINPHDWKAAKEANPERFDTYPVVITHELAGYVNEHLNRVMAREVESGSRAIVRTKEDKEDPFEWAHQAFSIGFHSNVEQFSAPLSEYQIMGICGIIREHSKKSEKKSDVVEEANRKILELRTRFEAALPKNTRQTKSEKTPSPSLGGVVKRWVDKFSNSKGTPYD